MHRPYPHTFQLQGLRYNIFWRSDFFHDKKIFLEGFEGISSDTTQYFHSLDPRHAKTLSLSL